jgi:type I restriction enzyme M protein
MSSQASSAGRDEAKVRQKLIETGHVDIMVSIRPNFFYTRTVPCELWFLNKKRPKQHEDKILMLDARGVYRKVTRKIYDFSPEQLQNLLSIVWLYRGEPERFRALVANHLNQSKTAAAEIPELLKAFLEAIDALVKLVAPFLATLPEASAHREPKQDFEEALRLFSEDANAFETALNDLPSPKDSDTAQALRTTTEKYAPTAESTRDLAKQADHVSKLLRRLVDVYEKELDAREHEDWNTRDITRAHKACDEARHLLVEQLRQVRYFQRQAAWLTERFPDASLVDVPGLVKLVDTAEIEKNDWSLTPGRYVGVAPEEVDEDFDFEETIRDIHIELEGLNEEAAGLAKIIAKNFMELIG